MANEWTGGCFCIFFHKIKQGIAFRKFIIQILKKLNRN